MSEIEFEGRKNVAKEDKARKCYANEDILIASLCKVFSAFRYTFNCRRDPLKHFEISVLRHIKCAELRKISIEQPNFTNEHVI